MKHAKRKVKALDKERRKYEEAFNNLRLTNQRNTDARVKLQDDLDAKKAELVQAYHQRDTERRQSEQASERLSKLKSWVNEVTDTKGALLRENVIMDVDPLGRCHIVPVDALSSFRRQVAAF